MRKMTERTIREILPDKIIRHYEQHNRFDEIEWVSTNEANTTARVRLSTGIVECWKCETDWNRYPMRDRYTA